MFENYVILEDVGWEWIILKQFLFENYIKIVENYIILGENYVILDYLNVILEYFFLENYSFSVNFFENYIILKHHRELLNSHQLHQLREWLFSSYSRIT